MQRVQSSYCGNCEKRWGDLLDFLFKKVGVPMFWNRGPVKVPLPLSDEKQEGGGICPLSRLIENQRIQK